jgi:hypothetical protein
VGASGLVGAFGAEGTLGVGAFGVGAFGDGTRPGLGIRGMRNPPRKFRSSPPAENTSEDCSDSTGIPKVVSANKKANFILNMEDSLGFYTRDVTN